MFEAKPFQVTATNTILYCRYWSETVTFYRDVLKFPITFASDWFVEFQLRPGGHLSIADENRASIKSSSGAGITLTFQVMQIVDVWHNLQGQGVAVGPVKDHAWGARVFYFFDPEGHRLEVWSPFGGG